MRRAVEQVEDRDVVLEVGARGVAAGVATAAVLLPEEAAEARAVLVDEAPLGADALVPQLGERLGHLHAEPVQVQVLLVPIVGEELGRGLADRRPHRHDVERRVVDLVAVGGPEEVGDAEELVLALTGVAEPGLLLRA